MTSDTITVTGSRGFVGQVLCAHLPEFGFRIRHYDIVTPLRARLLRRRFLGTVPSGPGAYLSNQIRRIQRFLEPRVPMRRTGDHFLDERFRLVEAFRGSRAVVHLAGIPHPFAPGTCAEDFRRINYDGAINVFEAAKAAGVRKFIFASSAQVYRINAPPRIEQFPILETNHLPGLDEGQTAYGFLKAEVERYLAGACADGSIQAISLRLEFPGFRSTQPSNFYVSTSVENLVNGFVAALRARDDFAAEAFNLADAQVDRSVVDIQAFLREHWPDTPNFTRGNESLLSTEKARRLLGYAPRPGGSYFRPEILS